MTTEYNEQEVLEYRDQHYTPFEEKLEALEDIITQKEPDQWWFSLMIGLKEIEREARKGQTIPEINQFVEEYFPKIQNILLHEATIEAEDHTVASHEVIHKIGEVFSEEEITENIEIHNITLYDLSEGFEEIDIEDTSENFITISIYSHSDNRWYSYVIPKSRDGNKLYHKGGLSRLILKIISNAPQTTIEAELPLNDVDFIAKGENILDLYKMASEAGGDKDGVEIVEEVDYSIIFKSRDLDLNGCLLSEDGLTFSEEAFQSAKSGKIEILANKRGIYGTEFFHYDGVRLIKNRGMMRLFKTVAEQKALEFDFLPLNEQVDFGIYWLVLANKFIDKPNAGQLLDRLFYLGKKTSQVDENEENIFDVLNRVHKEYPFFNFDRRKLDSLGLARWLTRKLTKQIDKAYRDKFNIPTYFPFERKPNDTIPFSVNLNGYTPNDEIINNFDNYWNQFLLKSRERYRIHKQSTLDEISDGELE